MPDGRWRWILFDTDFAFGLYTPDGYAHNMLQFATNPNGPSETIWGWDPWWPNPPWSTFLLRSLLENESFRNNFITQFADLLNTTFQPDEILNTVDEITDLLADEMPNHLARWGGELIRLYDANSVFIDQVIYDDNYPWPEEADGGGPTLELINPILDNALPESWAYSNNMYGTPGSENSTYQGLVTENILPVPTDFMLGQNYPNPFNPRTVIQYEVPTLGHVTITIYGREVIQLVNGIQEPGYRAIIWDAKNEGEFSVGAGLYFYQLKTAAYVNTKKMILVR